MLCSFISFLMSVFSVAMSFKVSCDLRLNANARQNCKIKQDLPVSHGLIEILP